MIVKVWGVPVQLTPPLVKVGVTVMVAVTGEVPLLMAVKEEMFPLPLAPSPIDVLSFNQLKVTVPPVLELTKATGAVLAPLHTV